MSLPRHDTIFRANQFLQTGPLTFASDASDLRLPPGTWPRSITVLGLGNERIFNMTEIDESRAKYAQEFGCLTITIWND
jgi:hypothetical protein